jgi:hypothetical protein
MSVIVHPTPNPNAKKFVLSSIRFAQPLSFPSVEAAATHPLAAQLFAVGGIYNVFMAQDFVTVNKLPAVDWDGLLAQLQPMIERFDAQRGCE